MAVGKLCKVIYPKYAKHWSYLLTATLGCGCSKISRLLYWLRFQVLLDVQANLPETSPFFSFAESVYSMYLGCITLELCLRGNVYVRYDALHRTYVKPLWITKHLRMGKRAVFSPSIMILHIQFLFFGVPPVTSTAVHRTAGVGCTTHSWNYFICDAPEKIRQIVRSVNLL